jgi:hypothetical protein
VNGTDSRRARGSSPPKKNTILCGPDAPCPRGQNELIGDLMLPSPTVWFHSVLCWAIFHAGFEMLYVLIALYLAWEQSCILGPDHGVQSLYVNSVPCHSLSSQG